MRINYNKINSIVFFRFFSFFRKIGPLLPILLLILAILVVRSLLKEFKFIELISGLKAIPKINILIAFILTILNYFMLTLYDYLGTRYVKAKIPIKKVALASFVAYAFSQNLGVSLLSGGAVRYRFYQKEGLSGSSIARIIGFTIFHFWLGLFLLAGVLAIILPESFSGLFKVSILLVRLIGLGVLLPGAIYIFFLFFPNILVRKYRRLIPRTKIGLYGVIVCMIDWVLAAGVFYCLLPGQHDITFLKTITVFIAAQVAGVISHVPGGLGVFEATVGYLLSPHRKNANIVSALIIFRSIYYFLPFILSIILMIVFELRLQYEKISQNKIKIAAGFEFLENLFLASSPIIGSMLCIFSGYSLLSSSVLPSDVIFPQIGKQLIPLLIFEASHFLSSLIGIILIFLGVGLRRRIKSTLYICATLLSIGLLLSIGKNHNLETLFILFNLGFLYLSRKSFYRSSNFKGSLITTRWGWTIGAVLFSTTIGFFSFEEIEYSNSLWFKFGVEQDAPRFLRSLIGMFFGLAFCGSYFLIAKPKEHEPTLPTKTDLPKILSILNKFGSTIGYLSLTLDKEILYSEDKEGFLMWRQSGSSMICFGDPQSSLDNFQELSWKFRESAEESSKICAFYEISANMIPSMLDLGLRVFKIGEEGVVDLTSFSLKGGKWAKIRNTASKMRKDGISFSVLEKDQVKARIKELREVSDKWLENKHVAEKGFSLGFFDEEFISNFRCGIVEHEGRILGFANILESTVKSELSIDLMRHTDESPHGVMDFLFINLFTWGKDNNYQSFSLGMAPLSGLSTNPLAPNYAKIGNVVFRHGGNFYNFEGLRKYKEKFEPTWVPRYLACPNGLYLPIVLSNISVLISGGVKGLIKK